MREEEPDEEGDGEDGDEVRGDTVDGREEGIAISDRGMEDLSGEGGGEDTEDNESGIGMDIRREGKFTDEVSNERG